MKEATINWDAYKKSGMVLSGYVQCNNEVIRRIIYETDPQTSMLYLLILSHRNTKTGACFPSYKLLSKEMTLSPRTIQRMVSSLFDIGALSVNSGTIGISNRYYFPMESFYEENAETSMAKKKSWTKFEEKKTSPPEKTAHDYIPSSDPFDDLDIEF